MKRELTVTVHFVAQRDEHGEETLIYHVIDPKGNEVFEAPFPDIGEGDFLCLQVARAFRPYLEDYEAEDTDA